MCWRWALVAGLTVEESYAVWRGNFTKEVGMTAEKWQKEYAYGIRYNYGLEGKRTNWSPHGCMRIISETGTNPAAGEHHGADDDRGRNMHAALSMHAPSVGACISRVCISRIPLVSLRMGMVSMRPPLVVQAAPSRHSTSRSCARSCSRWA